VGFDAIVPGEEEVMRCDYHILDRAFDERLGRARACKVGHRTVEMVIGVEQARTGTVRRGRFP
jgi:glutamate dehydrogenase (NAD(P)+)